MAAKTSTHALGAHFYSLGVLALGLVNLVLGDFDPMQPVPKTLPGRIFLAYAAASFLFAAGAAVQSRRTRAWAGGAIAAYYAVVVGVIMNGPLLVAGYKQYGTYSGIAEVLAVALGGLVLFAGGRPLHTGPPHGATVSSAVAVRLCQVSQRAFGVCALLFGGAHFVYMNLTAPLVPTWLPPGQLFWGYTTGAAFIAAGIALLAGIQSRLAAILLTAMIATFTLLVHVRMLWSAPAVPYNWTELGANLAILGAAWVIADSLQPVLTSNP
jgi:uncharacterized membrane protein YphA (DoxX/SURF4 family)